MRQGRGVADCTYFQRMGFISMHLTGCRHTCQRTSTVALCCPGYWGSDCNGHCFSFTFRHSWPLEFLCRTPFAAKLLPPPRRICNRRCLFVCLFDCYQLCTKTSERICMKFLGKVGNWPLNKLLNFGGDPDHGSGYGSGSGSG